VNNQFVPRGITFRDSDEKIRLETRNGVIQADFMFETAISWNSSKRLTPDILIELQRLAVNQIYRCAGHFRDGEVILDGVDHHPPNHSEVPHLVDEMCAYLNDHRGATTAVHLSAYAMWRVNWIHPFFGGNGRSARAFSYLVLLSSLGFALPVIKTIPELIVENRNPYFEALRSADEHWKNRVLNLSKMEDLISDLLAIQLVNLHKRATGA
jgi:Fic family protein